MRIADHEVGRLEMEGGADALETETEDWVVLYCSNHTTLGMDTNSPLAYAPGSELYHPTMIMVGGHKVQLERERAMVLPIIYGFNK